MKQLVRTDDGSHPKVTCDICGLTSSTIDLIDTVSINIDLPYFTTGMPQLGYHNICSNCKEAILDEIYDHLLQPPSAPSLFGINLKKYVDNFIKKNRDTFEDIASDYTRMENILEYFQTEIRKMQSRNEDDDSPTRGRPLPTTRMLYEFIYGINHNKLIPGEAGSKLKVTADATCIDLTDGNINSILGESTILAGHFKKTGDGCMVQIELVPELKYEEDVKITFTTLAINEKKIEEKEDETQNTINTIVGEIKKGYFPTGGFTIE